MRAEPSILHLDLDAFFAAVEQRDKPSLRGKPVIVGGLGPRGVVATASYEARVFGVGSAMPMAQARARCPHAAFLAGRFEAYREVSAVVMGLLHQRSPAVEPLSLDEAFLDLAAAGPGWTSEVVRATGAALRAEVRAATGLTVSVGAGSSKLIAKIASDLDKPDGLVVVEPGSETALLHPMPATRLPGVGPATADRLRRAGLHSVADLAGTPVEELVGLLGAAHGRALAALARGEDDRAVSTHRASRSISVEDTFDRDLVDRGALLAVLDRMAGRVAERLRAAGVSGRTVTVKVRGPDFATHTRSATLPGPTDEARVLAGTGRRLLGELDTTDGVRLLGIGASGLVDWAQEDLFTDHSAGSAQPQPAPVEVARGPRWAPGQDVQHERHGPGWVWGAGLGRVTVRFETRHCDPGPVRTFPADDPALSPRPTAGLIDEPSGIDASAPPACREAPRIDERRGITGDER